MAGRNQHHIPQFFQRGFGVPRSGKPKEIWQYTKAAGAELCLIKEAAAEFDFYSPPSTDGSDTLDDKITEVETPMARLVAGLRNLPLGATADAATAAEVVAHLAPRTSHLRLAFAQGMSGLFQAAAEVFGDQDNVKRLLGLDADAPTERFRENITARLQEDPQFSEIGLPEPVLEQVAFRLAKENFDALFGMQIPPMMAAFGEVLPEAEARAKDGHNQALAKMLDTNVRRDDLTEYRWTVEPAPSDGAILPDCVALGIEDDGSIQPFMMASRKVLAAVVMPLATDRLLVGRKPEAAQPDLANFNADAAACSHVFFLAATPGFSSLVAQLGDRSTSVIDAAIDNAVGEYRSPVPVYEEEASPPSATPQDESSELVPITKEFAYQLTFLDCADQATAKRIAETVKAIVGQISQVLPLNRLDGITFAADYAAGLASVDIGIPEIGPPQTVSEEIGVGVAMTIPVVRDGIVKCRIVLAGGIGPALIEEDHPSAAWALHVMVHELALVAITHWFDEAFPDVLFKPWPDPHEGRLYAQVNASVDGYVAAHISAGFGSEETADVYRELLVSALARARTLIPAERLAYRTHGDLDAFLGIAVPAASNILQFAGKLLGHCDGQGRSPFDEAGILEASLKESGLYAWLTIFQQDLQIVWERRGQWESLSELFRLNRHLERVLWQSGIFPWLTADGVSRIEIPIATDALALAQGMVNGTIPIPDGVDLATLPPEAKQILGIG